MVYYNRQQDDHVGLRKKVANPTNKDLMMTRNDGVMNDLSDNRGFSKGVTRHDLQPLAVVTVRFLDIPQARVLITDVEPRPHNFKGEIELKGILLNDAPKCSKVKFCHTQIASVERPAHEVRANLGPESGLSASSKPPFPLVRKPGP